MSVDSVDTYVAEASVGPVETGFAGIKGHSVLPVMDDFVLLDRTTRLLNRRGFEFFLTQYAARIKRWPESSVIAYLDIDGFRAIQSRFGAHVGDALLAFVGHLLERNIRSCDLVARLEHDLFALLLVNTDVVKGRLHVDRLSDLCQASPLELGDAVIAPTMSVGLTALTPGCDIENVLLRLDKEIYRAKTSAAESTAIG